MADNLLDKASILLTPTASDNGSMLSIKPENGDGDFQFQRNSAATRVNAQGLVENVQILSTELVTNGDFATDSDWIKGNGTTISGGQANLDGSLSGSFQDPLRQSSVFTVGKTYKVEYTISNYVSGAVTVFGNGATEVSSNGTYTQYINATITTLSFQNRAVPITCSIDNVSVKELVDDTNIPRIDYTDGCGSYLLEGQSTNLITYSSDFSSLNSRDNAVVTSNEVISPSGDLDADKITFDGTLYGRVEQTITATIGQPYTISLYLKNKDLSDVTQVWIGFSQVGQGQFVTITDEWQRYEVTINADGTSEYPRIQFSGTGSLYAWGFQTEQQSYATSYIPTNGATNTRLQDIANNSGNSTLINSTEGVLYAEISLLSPATSSTIISLSDGGANRLYFEFFTSNRLYAIIENGSSSFNTVQTITQTDNNKIAFKYSASGCKLYVNGVGHSFGGLNFTSDTLDRLNFASSNGTTSKFFGKAKALAVYKEALTDAQLQSLTTI